MTMDQPQWGAPPAPQQPPQMPAGWYPDATGSQRYWDGAHWAGHVAPPAPPAYQHAYQQPVPVQPNVRQAADRAQYTRQQTGHSLIKHLIFGIFALYIPTIYYAVSPNHYFHA